MLEIGNYSRGHFFQPAAEAAQVHDRNYRNAFRLLHEQAIELRGYLAPHIYPDAVADLDELDRRALQYLSISGSLKIVWAIQDDLRPFIGGILCRLCFRWLIFARTMASAVERFIP